MRYNLKLKNTKVYERDSSVTYIYEWTNPRIWVRPEQTEIELDVSQSDLTDELIDDFIKKNIHPPTKASYVYELEYHSQTLLLNLSHWHGFTRIRTVHEILGDLYESLTESIDEMIEVGYGCLGRDVDFSQSTESHYVFHNFDTKYIIEYLRTYIDNLHPLVEDFEDYGCYDSVEAVFDDITRQIFRTIDLLNRV